MSGDLNPNNLVLIGFGLSILATVLGFVALLTQRIYMDASTQKPVEFEIPLLGKMKSNYPALAFVFMGCFLAWYTMQSVLPLYEKPKMLWTVTGSFSDRRISDWRTRGKLILTPKDPDYDVDENGHFTIKIHIEKPKTFENIIDNITFTYPDRPDVTIYPSREYDAYRSGQASRLDNAGDYTRTYKRIALPQFQARE